MEADLRSKDFIRASIANLDSTVIGSSLLTDYCSLYDECSITRNATRKE